MRHRGHFRKARKESKDALHVLTGGIRRRGDLVRRGKQYWHLIAVIPDACAVIEKGGAFATLKFAAQTGKAATVLDARIRQMVSAAKDVGARREI